MHVQCHVFNILYIGHYSNYQQTDRAVFYDRQQKGNRLRNYKTSDSLVKVLAHEITLNDSRLVLSTCFNFSSFFNMFNNIRDERLSKFI